MTTYNNKKFNKSQLPFFMTDEDLEKLPPPSWLVDDLIPETGIGVIYGESGSYKSFLTIDLLAHIGNGKAWFGKDTKQKPVIYIALEGKGGIPKRIKSWKIHNHSSSNIKVIHNPIDFRDNSNIEYLIEKIKDAELDGGVICIDTLAQAGGDMDENSSKDMGKMIKTFQHIQQELGGVVLMNPIKYNELRFTRDDRNESLGKKIREATNWKIPVQLIVGPKDKEAREVSVRTQNGEEKVSLDQLGAYLENL